MIVMGAGTNHWFHSDQIYRAMLNLVLLCGCQGVNGGGWAHYVGQEKVRTITGFTDPRASASTGPGRRATRRHPLLVPGDRPVALRATHAGERAVGRGTLRRCTSADCNALAARLGWMPSYPTFDRNPLEIADEAERERVPRRPTTSCAS